MKVFIIHDFRRPTEEFDACVQELDRQRIPGYLFIPATYTGFDTVEGCINDSHKRAIQLAKDMKAKSACVMESDVWFPAADAWSYFLYKKPSVYDIYLAATYGPIKGCMSAIPGNDEMGICVDHPCGFHCYIMHESYYDTFLSTPEETHIDTAQSGGFYPVCFPFAALQRPGWSANNKRVTDYNHDLETNHRDWVYGWD